MVNLDLKDSTLALGTLKNFRFFFSSSSFSDLAPAMKLTCSTTHPWCCSVLLNADRKHSYCSSVYIEPSAIYRLVMSDIRLNSNKQITPALVFVGILNAMPSGLLFHSLSCTIFSCETPSLLFFASAGVRGRSISVSLAVFLSVCSKHGSKTSGNSCASSFHIV